MIATIIAKPVGANVISPATGMSIISALNVGIACNAVPVKFAFDCNEISVRNTLNVGVNIRFYLDGSPCGDSPTIDSGSYWSESWEFDEVRITCIAAVGIGELWIRGN